MRLRPKKTMDLSESDCHSLEKGLKAKGKKHTSHKQKFYDESSLENRSTSKTSQDEHMAKILVKFINNINFAITPQQRGQSKQRSLRRFKANDSLFQKPLTAQYSEFSGSVEQKKADYRNLLKESFQARKRPRKLTELDIEQQSVRREPRSNDLVGVSENIRQHQSDLISSNKIQPNQQPILNALPSNPWNFQIPLFLFNPPFQPNWMTAANNENIQSYPSIPTEMAHGLLRQLQMYEMCKHEYTHEKLQFHKENRFPFKEKQQSPVKDEKLLSKAEPSHSLAKEILAKEKSEFSPQKVFKRASFHVGIAYNIFLDRLRKKGISMYDRQETDPTRQARRLKTNNSTTDFSKFSNT